ncbi:MAG: DUF4340 domain-containing protein, partial [Myxococcota bacterium]
VEGGRISDVELEGRDARLVERFNRGRVDRIELRRQGAEPIAIEREESDDGSIAGWRMRSPKETLADETAVGSLLGAIEWSDARRSFAAQDGDVARFGLDEARIELRLRFGGDGAETVNVLIGSEAEGGVYLTADGGRTIKVAAIDLFESLDHDAEHFESKVFLERGVLTANRLRIREAVDEARETLLERDERNWRVDARFARTSFVDEALQAITNLEADRFVEVAVSEPSLEVEAVRPRGADEGEGEAVRVAFAARRGGPCEGRQWHLTLEGGRSGCLPANAMEPLLREDFRDRNVLRVPASNVRSVRLEGQGETMVVARGDDGSWSGTDPIDADAMDEWLGELRRQRVTAFETTCPSAVWSAEFTGDGEHRLGLAQDSEDTLVTRSGEEGCVRAAGSLWSLLADARQRLRPREVLAVTDVRELRIDRGDVVERVVETDGRFALVEPFDAAVDEPSVRRVLNAVEALRATRFGAPELRAPVVTIRVQNDEGEYTLAVGAPSEGEAAAQVDDGERFYLEEGIARGLRAVLLSQELLAVPPYELTGVALEGASQAIYRLEDGEFRNESGDPADPDRFDAFTTALSTLRALPVSYESAAVETRLRIELTLEGGESRLLRVGGPAPRGAYLTQDGLNVRFSVPESFVRAAEALLP